MSLLVSTCTSLTSPSGVTTTRADNTPVNAVIRFSTRFMPHGSGVPPPPSGKGSCSEDDDGDGFEGVTAMLPPLPLWPPDCGPPPSPDTARDRRRPARL